MCCRGTPIWAAHARHRAGRRIETIGGGGGRWRFGNSKRTVARCGEGRPTLPDFCRRERWAGNARPVPCQMRQGRENRQEGHGHQGVMSADSVNLGPVEARGTLSRFCHRECDRGSHRAHAAPATLREPARAAGRYVVQGRRASRPEGEGSCSRLRIYRAVAASDRPKHRAPVCDRPGVSSLRPSATQMSSTGR